MRLLTKARGLKKYLGQSWIKIKKNMYIFSAGSTLLDGTGNVYEVLEDLIIQIDTKKYLYKACITMDNCNVI